MLTYERVIIHAKNVPCAVNKMNGIDKLFVRTARLKVGYRHLLHYFFKNMFNNNVDIN